MKLSEIFDDDFSIVEAWSKKYKKSIDCSNPKGFSQKAHCAGRHKRQSGGNTSSKSVSEAFVNEAIPAHGDAENEFKMMKAGTKPAVTFVIDDFLNWYKPYIEKQGWEFMKFPMPNQPDHFIYIVGQKGEKARVKRIAELVSSAMKAGKDMGPEYHKELGKLLGYSEADINEFLKKMYPDKLNEAPWMYHGTTKDFDKLKANRDEYMMDRALGAHFAADPDMAAKFAKGLHTHRDSTVSGTVLKTNVPPRSQLMKVPQKKRQSDQTAISSFVAGTVFQQPENKEMFIDWIMNSRMIDREMAEEIYHLLSQGKSPADKKFGVAASKGSNSFRSYVRNFDANLTMMSRHPTFRQEVIKKFIDIMKSKGIKGMVYKNTSPMEIQDVRSHKSYVIFEPESHELVKHGENK